MRVDPVYLIGGRTSTLAPVGRRSFMGAIASLVCGMSVGCLCGYLVGSHAAQASAATWGTQTDLMDMHSSGDIELDELRRLAVQAPIEELVQHRLLFIAALSLDYRRDPVLWAGVGRLCDEILSRRDYPDRRRAATSMAQVIELGEPGLQRLFGGKIKDLRSIK